MQFDLTILGFGVIGVETLDALVLKINKKQKIRVAIIEKNINNIPGGVAYSKKNSKFGYFNNPLRLSPKLLLLLISSFCFICTGYLVSLIELLKTGEVTSTSVKVSADTKSVHINKRENIKIFLDILVSYIN